MCDFRDVALFTTSNDTLNELSELSVIPIKVYPETGITRETVGKSVYLYAIRDPFETTWMPRRFY